MKNVDEVRHAMFQQHYAPKNDKDPLQKIKGINPSSMPPCHQVLMNKIKRANYVAALWKRATKQTPSTFSPNGNGWELKDDHIILNGMTATSCHTAYVICFKTMKRQMMMTMTLK